MKTLHYIIIKIEQAYNNDIELESGSKIKTNTTLESVAHINRKAVVVSAPEYTILKEGDEVIIHHNIVRFKYSHEGRVLKGDYFIEDDMYFVPLQEVFAYRRDGDWTALDPYCFIEPIKNNKNTDGGILLSALHMESRFHKGNKKQLGRVVFGNKQLSQWGVEEGDEVIFRPHSEYEFDFNGTVLYKMRSIDILGKLNVA